MSKYLVRIQIPTTVDFQVEATDETEASAKALDTFASMDNLPIESDYENARVLDIMSQDELDEAVKRGFF